MPYTPFHWGPGLLSGLLLLGYIDLPTLLVSSVIVDVEPFLVLTLNLSYPLHGYLHTFLGGTIVAFLLALAMSRVREAVQPLMLFFRLKQKTSFRSIILASLFGVYLHILLDSPLYPDIRPFYPCGLNLFWDMKAMVCSSASTSTHSASCPSLEPQSPTGQDLPFLGELEE